MRLASRALGKELENWGKHGAKQVNHVDREIFLSKFSRHFVSPGPLPSQEVRTKYELVYQWEGGHPQKRINL